MTEASTLWAALMVGAAFWLALPVRPDDARLGARPGGAASSETETSRAWHLGLSVVVGVAAGLLLGRGPLSVVVVAALVGGGAWRLLLHSAGAPARRTQEAGIRELPHLVALLAAGLRSGAAPPAAREEACRALPGPASDLVAAVRPRLAWGTDPAQVWADLAGDPALGALGRTLARAHETGASVVDSIDALATQLAAESRAEVEDRARAVGVRAALPLGVCLLPAFLLLGIVPSIAALISQLALG